MKQDPYKVLNIYEDIGEETTKRFAHLFETVDPKDEIPILLNFNSLGGDPREVDKIIQMKASYPKKVIGVVGDGCVAKSAAFVLFELICDKRLVAPNAVLMHKDLTRDITIEITPATNRAKVSEFIHKHAVEVKNKQLVCDKKIAKRCGLSGGDIISLKTKGDIIGLEAVNLKIADDIFVDF